MAIVYKISSNYQQLSAYILLKFILGKNKLAHPSIVIPRAKIYFINDKQITLNKNFMLDRRMSKSSSQNGFTLIELIVTVAVLAIIMMIAAPAILTQLARMEAQRIRYGITDTLKLAKAESVIRRQNLLVCLSDGNGLCHKNSNKTLLLFVDNNDNQHFDKGTDELLETQNLNPKYGTLHLRAGKRRYVRFYGDSGKPRGHFGHFKYCANSTYSQAMYQISFSQGANITFKPNDSHPTGCGD
ncbi:GspH/FimT family pseudopilin [Psychrobacter sp. PAMC 21119]|uniref:GspH/FimT family pseudopilin n=1 Tax=Psychrobacter sp. PAMC 21119 TaxID=1112209 RepID=UPI001D0D4C8D|nr:GspH/FimT family pseudopilin [Psychrobacter sp. PAMC 21119]